MTAPAARPAWTQPESMRWASWGWDHPLFYRRLGPSDVSFFGNTGWLDAWWRRLHDERTLDRIAELGVNVLITHFFKGMGLEAERPMLDDLRQLAARCRPRGIRLIGYTFGTIFAETFPKEVPEAEDWAARAPDGTPLTWGGTYYRWAPCLNSGYYAYLLRLVERGAREFGLNGFHFDNAYAVPCYCDRCRRAFRAFLETRVAGPERLGFTGFTRIVPPPPQAPTRDPLKQEWIRFRTLQLAEKMEGLRRHIKAIDPDLALLSNPAFPRNAHWADRLGVDPFHFGRAQDLMFAENANFPGVLDGRVVSQARAYAFGSSIGYGVIVSSWPRSDRTGEIALPATDVQAARNVLEPALFGHPPGTTWACRSVRGDRLALDEPPLWAGARRAFAFLDARRDLFAGAATPDHAGLLHASESFALAHDRVAPAYDGFERLLSLRGVPYRIVFPDDPDGLEGCRFLVVSNQVCLSDAAVAAIRAFVQAGGRLVVTGASGERDARLVARDAPPFADLANHPNVLCLPDAPETAPLEPDRSGKWLERQPWSLPPRHAELAAALDRAFAGAFFPFRLDAPPTVLPVLKALPDGRQAIHLLNYAAPAPAGRVTLALGRWFDGCARARIHRLEGDPTSCPIGPDRTLVIPDLALYAGVEL